MFRFTICLLLTMTLISCHSSNQPEPDLLPENFKVYINEEGSILNHPEEGFAEKVLPTFNHYKGEDGGYVAFYTHEKEGSIYSVGGDIYVFGQIRVQGQYIGRIFYPIGYSEGDDITKDAQILDLCFQYMPSWKDKDVWLGGDTGGWLGL